MRTRFPSFEKPAPGPWHGRPNPEGRTPKEWRRPKSEGTGSRGTTVAAFTLVEILIALGIFSIVLAAIYSSWTAILRASKAGLEAAAAVQRARIAGRTRQETMCYV